MTYQSICPQCGGPTWDNSADDKPGGDWKCKNKECRDRDGYVYNEWSWNKEQTDKRKQEGGPGMPKPAMDVEPADDLPFEDQRWVNMWEQSFRTINVALDRCGMVLHDEEALEKLYVTQFLALKERLPR